MTGSLSPEEEEVSRRSLILLARSATENFEEIFPDFIGLRNIEGVGRKAFERARNYLKGLYHELDELGVDYDKRFNLDELT